MEPRIVRELEREIERLLLTWFQDMRPEQIPLHPSHRTIHLMAKAATSVYEAAEENTRRRSLETDF